MKKFKKLLSLTLTCAILLGGTLAGSVQSSATVGEYSCPRCGEHLWDLFVAGPNCSECGKASGQYICNNCESIWFVCPSGHLR